MGTQCNLIFTFELHIESMIDIVIMIVLSEEYDDSRKEKMLLKLTFKYCQLYANAILILQDV